MIKDHASMDKDMVAYNKSKPKYVPLVGVSTSKLLKAIIRESGLKTGTPGFHYGGVGEKLSTNRQLESVTDNLKGEEGNNQQDQEAGENKQPKIGECWCREEGVGNR